jgi:hypothetical protein
MKNTMQELGMFYPSSITLIVYGKEYKNYKNYKVPMSLFQLTIEIIRLKQNLNQDKELLNQNK